MVPSQSRLQASHDPGSLPAGPGSVPAAIEKAKLSAVAGTPSRRSASSTSPGSSRPLALNTSVVWISGRLAVFFVVNML